MAGQALIEHDPREYLEAPLATVAPILASADAAFTNLEVAVAEPGCDCRPTRDDVFFHGAGPEVLDYLGELGVSLLSLANNHSWDYGADFVIAYQHYQIDGPPGWQERWARATVDAGADLYISHGEPRLAGVEAYGGGLILYGLGNFIFHSRTEIGNYARRRCGGRVLPRAAGLP